MSTEQVAPSSRGARVQRTLATGDEERWRAYFDTDDELVFYCPECAEREFGDASLVANAVAERPGRD